MSLVNLSHVCSHLQNASKARLGLTSIPFCKQHMHLSHQLQKSGFVSTVTLGGLMPPPASSLLAHPPAPPLLDKTPPTEAESELRHRALGPLHKPPDPEEPKVWDLFSLPESLEQPDHLPEHIPLNPARRRLWLGLKYWDNEPVLGHMQMVSKPTRRIWMGVRELADIARGTKRGYIKGMRQIGECMFISTDRGIMEIRECVERGLGGMLLCRAW